jgi:hypothetical protein
MPLKDRQFTQIVVDLVYRFGQKEKFYVGAKYNTLKGTQVFGQSTTAAVGGGINQGERVPISVDRASFGGGWFITRNILVKGEYVSQTYNDYPVGELLQGGKFKGFVLQGSIAF